MNRVLICFGLAAIMLIIPACRKSEPAAPTQGPALNPPAATDSDAPAESTSPAKEEQGAKIGAPGPVWADLEGTDGKTHGLKDLADAKVVAVVFTCNQCPVAKAYEDRLVNFAADYQDKGVELVAINVNNDEKNKLPAMKERAADKEFNFAYIYDPSQEIAREYGATVTPHIFVLDQGRDVVYMGAIDDNMDESAATHQYLRDAVDAALAGQAPEVTAVKPSGCGIKYE